MKVLLPANMRDQYVEQIRTVSDEVEVIQRKSEEEVLEVMPEVEVVLGSLSREMFVRAEQLRWFQTTSAGVDRYMYPEFIESGIILTSSKGTVGVQLSEQAMGLLLGLTRAIGTAIRKADWKAETKAQIRQEAWELIGLTMGIVGLGGTGRALAVRAHGFGMRIIAVDPEEVEVPDCVEACWKVDRFHDLLAESDVVAVCCPLTKDTEGLFDREAFRQMQNHALLINVTRGRIMDEAALVEALEQRQIAGAGLDVTPQEPLPEDHPLWKMENVIVTPHVASASPNQAGRVASLFTENLRRLLHNEPMLSVIDKQKQY